MATDATTGKLTYSDYAAIPNDGKRHEIIDGVHYVNAAPHLYHQAVSKRLQYELYTKIELTRSEEHTSELQSRSDLVCRLLLEKTKKKKKK